jgi:hypothetical protein
MISPEEIEKRLEGLFKNYDHIKVVSTKLTPLRWDGVECVITFQAVRKETLARDVKESTKALPPPSNQLESPTSCGQCGWEPIGPDDAHGECT